MSNTVAEESDTRLSPNAQGNDRVRVAADAGKVKTAAPFALIVDDNAAIGRLVAKALAGLGGDSATYQSAKLAIDSLDQQRPDIIFLDIALIEGDAIDVIKGLSEKHHTGVVQLMSGGR